jgi:hypothetical protein
MMLSPAQPHFPHRQNGDGSYDSTCSRCLATVASAQKEEQLYPCELAHVCDRLRLYKVSQGWWPSAAASKDV